MNRSTIARTILLALALMARQELPADEPSAPPVPLELIQPGTRIDESRNVDGGGQLVLLAIPRVAAGDTNSVSAAIRKYASMFCMALIAKVEKTESGYRLADLRVGNCVATRNGWTVVSADSHAEHGVELDYFARQVLSRTENNLRNARVIAQSDAFRIFDADAVVRDDSDHVPMTIRHIVWVNAKSGKLATMIWLLRSDKSGLTMFEDVFHALPARYTEDRVFNVKADEITFGIPSAKALAIEKLPRGKIIPASPLLKELAAQERYTLASQDALVEEFNRAIRNQRTK